MARIGEGWRKSGGINELNSEAICGRPDLGTDCHFSSLIRAILGSVVGVGRGRSVVFSVDGPQGRQQRLSLANPTLEGA
jgi:hypothetical protein